MITKVEKIVDLEYDETVVLVLIESNQDLKEILEDDVKLSFNMMYTLSKEGNLPSDIKEMVRKIFDKIILTSKPLINKYLLLGEKDNKSFSKLDTSVDEIVVETKVEVIEPEISPKTPSKKEKKLPRRYGKVNIERDIEKQGGKATNAQLTALAVNDLKNIYVTLSNRLINDMLGDNPTLTDENYREIRSAINIVKAKLKDIIKKK